MNTINISEILKIKRLEMGYSQKQLGKILNIKRQAISNWERGLTYPSFKHLMKIENVLFSNKDTITFEDLFIILNRYKEK